MTSSQRSRALLHPWGHMGTHIPLETSGRVDQVPVLNSQVESGQDHPSSLLPQQGPGFLSRTDPASPSVELLHACGHSFNGPYLQPAKCQALRRGTQASAPQHSQAGGEDAEEGKSPKQRGPQGPEEGPWVSMCRDSQTALGGQAADPQTFPERASGAWNALAQVEGIKGFKGQEQSRQFVGGTAGNWQRRHWTGGLRQDGKRPYLTRPFQVSETRPTQTPTSTFHTFP